MYTVTGKASMQEPSLSPKMALDAGGWNDTNTLAPDTPLTRRGITSFSELILSPLMWILRRNNLGFKLA